MSRTDDSYKVVSKLLMHLWKIVFAHTVTDTVCGCFGTNRWIARRRMGYRCLIRIPLLGMTTRTLSIIETGGADQRLMWIVACCAGKPRILRLLKTGYPERRGKSYNKSLESVTYWFG